MRASIVAVSAILLSLSVVSFSTVKQRPRTVLPPCGKTDYCKITSVRMCDLSVQKLGGVRTVHTYCSDDAIRITRTLRCPSRTRKSEVYFGLNRLLILSMRVNWHVVAKLLIVSKMLFYQLMYQTVSLNCNWLKNDSVSQFLPLCPSEQNSIQVRSDIMVSKSFWFLNKFSFLRELFL